MKCCYGVKFWEVEEVKEVEEDGWSLDLGIKDKKVRARGLKAFSLRVLISMRKGKEGKNGENGKEIGRRRKERRRGREWEDCQK